MWRTLKRHLLAMGVYKTNARKQEQQWHYQSTQVKTEDAQFVVIIICLSFRLLCHYIVVLVIMSAGRSALPLSRR